jgi:hypothetical protein
MLKMNAFVKNDLYQFVKVIFSACFIFYVRNGFVRFSNPSFVSGP